MKYILTYKNSIVLVTNNKDDIKRCIEANVKSAVLAQVTSAKRLYKATIALSKTYLKVLKSGEEIDGFKLSEI